MMNCIHIKTHVSDTGPLGPLFKVTVWCFCNVT